MISSAPERPKGAAPPFQTREADKVGLGEKVALGAGYLPYFYGDNGVKSLAIPVYQMVLKVDPALLGLILAIPRFWDALTDPIVGMISDNSRSRFGRRKPIIVLGAILQAATFGAIWMVPEHWSQPAIVAYLVVTLIAFYTCFSIFSVPLLSLTYEMTADYQERTRVSAFGGLFNKIGEISYSWAFWIANLAVFGSVMHGVRTVGWTIAICIMGLVGMIPGLFVRERQFKRIAKQEKVRLVPALKASFSNRAFIVLIGITVCQVLAGMLASNIDYYLIVYYMSGGDIVEGTKWKGVLSTGYAILGIGMIYPVNWLANRVGKRTTLMAIFSLVLAGGVAKWFIYTPGTPWKILPRSDPVRPGLGPALHVLTPAMLADVCDDDELRHGLRREGVLGSLFSWIRKTGFALAFFGAGIALNIVGFDAALGGQPIAGCHSGHASDVVRLDRRVGHRRDRTARFLPPHPTTRLRNPRSTRSSSGPPLGLSSPLTMTSPSKLRKSSGSSGPETHLPPKGAERPEKRATIYDLARIAEVSPGTVSRVLNNRDKVKPETRERVLRAANALNLKPQVSVRFRQVAILTEPNFPDRIEGYAATLTAHLSFAFSRRNIGVVLPSNPFEQLPTLFLDGLIAVTFDKQLQALLADLESRMHVVYMDKFEVQPNEYVVRSDHFNSGMLAAQHFIARGKRRLGFLGGHNNAPFIERLRGYRKAIADAGLAVDERLQILAGPETNHLSAVTRIVRSGADCIYVPGTTFQAMECLHILSYVMGVKVPQEISLIGGENEGISALQNPPLTTIEDPLREMAERAADMLDKLTSGERVANPHLTLPVRLIERDSVS